MPSETPQGDEQKTNKICSFVDAVHGHIHIPQQYCKEIIDTDLFQRLKRIEQTSMRPLFPSARHDRFSHSLGTCHIGILIFDYLEKNIKKRPELYKKINDIVPPTSTKKLTGWGYFRTTYQLSCLLHDCGHAPFSHTFEKYYEKSGSGVGKKILNEDVKTEYGNAANKFISNNSVASEWINEFNSDYDESTSSPHEKVSAWLLLHEKGFCDKVIKLEGDPLIAARMIMGCKFKNVTGDFYKQICNCFIGLLNGDAIDADRLDYAIRDKWATGLNTNTINLERLLSSINIKEKGAEHLVCFSYKALPELENIIEIKNYNNFWIFNHRKLIYHNRLLVDITKLLAVLLTLKIDTYSNNPDGIGNDALYEFFDYNTLIEPREYSITLGGKQYTERLYQLCDDDIVCLLKKFLHSQINVQTDSETVREFMRNATTLANEYISRKHNHLSIWKSYADFHINYLGKFADLGLLDLAIKLLQTNNCPNNKDTFLKSLFDRATHIGVDREKNYTICKLLLDSRCDSEFGADTFDKDQLLRLCQKCWSHYMMPDGVYTLQNVVYDITTIVNEILEKLNNGEKLISSENHEKLVFRTDRIKENELFIFPSDDSDTIISYTNLELPTKSNNKAYDLFYIFVPPLPNKTNRNSRKFYRDKIMDELKQLIIPDKFIEKPADP